MSRIPRPVHGLLDYLTGIFVAASPWLLGFKEQRLAPEFALAVGGGIVLYSLFTSYELGVVHLLPFRFHLFIDLVVGVFLAFSWVYAFGGRAGVVFTLVGIFDL